MNIEKTIYGIDTALIINSIKSFQRFPVTVKELEVLPDVVADAIVAYDAARGAALATWVCYFVPRNIKRYLENKKRATVSLDMEVGGEDTTTTTLHTLIDSGVNVEDTVVIGQMVASVRNAIAKLDEKEQMVANAYINSHIEGNGRVGQELATSLSVSRERARQMKVSVFNKIRNLIREGELV